MALILLLLAAVAAENAGTDPHTWSARSCNELPLCDHATQGNLPWVSVALRLLKAGHAVDLDEQDYHGFSALMVSAENGHANVVAALLAAKAKVDLRCRDGSTALIFAAYRGHAEIVRLLLEAGAEPGLKGTDGKAALGHSVRDDVRGLLRAAMAKQRPAKELRRRRRLELRNTRRQ